MQSSVSVRLPKRLLHTTSKRDVIFFEQDRVVKADAMICAASHLDRIFFEQAQPRSCFTRVAYARVCPRKSLYKFMRQRGDAAQMREKIQRGSLACQNRAAASVQMQKIAAFGNGLRVMDAKFNLHFRIERAKDAFRQRQSRANDVLSRHDVRTAPCRSGNCRQYGRVARADILRKRSLHELGDVFAIPLHECSADYDSTAQLGQAIIQLLQLDLLGHYSYFHVFDNACRRALTECRICKLFFLGLNCFGKTLDLLLQPS